MALNWSGPGEMRSCVGWMDRKGSAVQPGRIFALERDPGVGQGPGRSLALTVLTSESTSGLLSACHGWLSDELVADHRASFIPFLLICV